MRRCAQTGESWNKAVRPKVLGAWTLDAATRGLASLEHFVCFSSVSGTLGNAGALRLCPCTLNRICPEHSVCSTAAPRMATQVRCTPAA